MKIAVLGYARSGSTMLYHIIRQHLQAAGMLEEWAGIGEAFNPHKHKLLIHRPDTGHLQNLENLPIDMAVPQMRKERLQLFNAHLVDDYIVKVMGYDISLPELRDTITANYNIIAIERKNPLSAYISGLVAYHHDVWNLYNNEKPVYEPFVVPELEIHRLGLSLTYYYHWRDRMNPQAVLYYEDVATQSSEATLRQAGLYQEGVPTEDSPTKKLLSFEEKMKLIINLEEVVEHFMGIITPYMLDIEHNEL